MNLPFQRHRSSTNQGEWNNIAENIIQGDYIRDVAHPEHEAAHAVPQEGVQQPAASSTQQADESDIYLDVEGTGAGTAAGNGAHAAAAMAAPHAQAMASQPAAPATTADAASAGAGAGATAGAGSAAAVGGAAGGGSVKFDGRAGGSVHNLTAEAREAKAQKAAKKDEFKRAIVGEDTGSKVAPKWWSKVRGGCQAVT